MMKISLLTILLITGVFAQELEVEGSLKVIGEIDAQGNAITNVGNPTQDNDAVNLSTVRGMSGMKPDRIYSYIGSNGEYKSLTVPSGKYWLVSSTFPRNSGYIGIEINGYQYGNLSVWESDRAASTTYVAFENNSFENTLTKQYCAWFN